MKASEIRKGDKIRVTYESYDVTRVVIGVADDSYGGGNWYTKGDICLQTRNADAQIELLERPDPWEKRKDDLATQFAGGQVKYVNAWPSTKRAIDFIIEEEKKEAK